MKAPFLRDRSLLPVAILSAALAATTACRTESSLMTASITPPTAARSAEVEREVLAVVQEWNAAFAANDVERYFSFVHPEITVLTPSNPYRVEGKQQDRDEFVHGVETGRSRVSFFQMLLPRVQVHGGSAVVTYFWRGSLGPDAALATFKETDVFVREPDGWKLLHVHLSRSG